jgi:4-hydroxybenzoate polyprenyltransferase
MFMGILRSMRPQQWVKNLFVLAPLVFGQQLRDAGQILLALSAFALFCLASGAVYLLNDVADVARDRAHPVKKFRPVASGRVPERVALVASAVAAVLALGGALVVGGGGEGLPGLRLAGCILAYLLINLLYSHQIKHVAWVDVTAIAAGFLIRVIAGGVAIDVAVSHWLLACTFLIAIFLGLGKRRHELGSAGDDAATRRGVLRHYREGHVALAMAISGAATVVAYSMYTLSPHSAVIFGGRPAWVTIPFIVVGIARFHVLTARHDDPHSPTERMLRDALFVANAVLWGVVVVALIYVFPQTSGVTP